MRQQVGTRVFFSLALVLAWFLMAHISLPFINRDLLREGPTGFQSFASLLAAQLLPFLAAYVGVMILALIFPPLKRWRLQGGQGRVRLRRAALWLCIPVAMVQAYFYATLVLSYGANSWEPLILLESVPLLRLFWGVTFAAVAFLLLWSASLNGRKGIGNGISLFILLMTCDAIFWGMRYDQLVQARALSPEVLITNLVVMAIFFGAVVFVEKAGPLRSTLPRGLPLRRTPAGIFPGLWAVAVLRFLPDSMPDGFVFEILVQAATVTLFCFILGSFFYGRGKLSKLCGDLDPRAYRGWLIRSCAFNAAYLLGFLLLPKLVFLISGVFIRFSGLEIMIVAAIFLDLKAEFQCRNTAAYQKVADFHDVAAADYVRTHLQQAGIPFFFRGYHHRALGHYLAPYIEIELMVPESERQTALGIMSGRLQGPASQWLNRVEEIFPESSAPAASA